MRVDTTILDDAGKQFVGSAELQPASSPKTLREPRGRRQPESLPDHILALRNSGFFAKPKTPAEIHAELQTSYHCELNRVEVALFRLQRRKELRKTSKVVGGKTQVAYVW